MIAVGATTFLLCGDRSLLSTRSHYVACWRLSLLPSSALCLPLASSAVPKGLLFPLCLISFCALCAVCMIFFGEGNPSDFARLGIFVSSFKWSLSRILEKGRNVLQSHHSKNHIDEEQYRVTLPREAHLSAPAPSLAPFCAVAVTDLGP